MLQHQIEKKINKERNANESEIKQFFFHSRSLPIIMLAALKSHYLTCVQRDLVLSAMTREGER